MATFNVKDYGAVGDGIKNDTAAIQACLDAAECYRQLECYFNRYGSERIIFLPPGAYKVNGALEI